MTFPIVRSKRPPIVNAQDLIRAREARGLMWSLAARLVFVTIIVIFVVLHLLHLISPGIAAQTDRDAAGMLAIQLGAALFILYFMHLARRQTKLTVAGLGAVILDVSLVSLMAVIWYNSLSLPGGSPAFLMKDEFAVIGVVFVAVNALALRPVYPALAAGGFILQQVAIAAFVLSHPRTLVTPQYLDHFYPAAVNPGVTVLRILFLAVVGASLAFLAKTARKTIHDAVALEVTNMEIRERQAEMLHEGKMTALSGLVAGVAHEINTPLGTVSSGLDTAEKAASRLAELARQAGADAGSTERLLDISRETNSTARAGVGRITRIVGSLRNFARLDEAEFQRADLCKGLESTLALIDRDKMGAVELVKELSDLPPLLCRPKMLNQVFMTILVNALEALKGEGELRISTAHEDGRLTIEIADTGPGIAAAELESLFELRFSSKGGRMAMGLGLPTARRIVERHGGTLTVESTVGEGTVFTIALPVEASAAEA